MDWNKLKAEYIAGGTSYRKLAKKYGVSFSSVRFKAEQEKWTDLKAQAQHSANTRIVESIVDDSTKQAVNIDNVADQLLEKITTLLCKEDITTQSVKHLTSALKDIREIKGIKTDIDLREQEARIKKLQKEVEEEKKDTNITITFGDEVKKYGV